MIPAGSLHTLRAGSQPLFGVTIFAPLGAEDRPQGEGRRVTDSARSGDY